MTKAWTIIGYTLDGEAYCASCGENGDAVTEGTPIFASDGNTNDWTCRSCEARLVPKRCDCGNKIDPRELGEDATRCEWCENPEVPIYKINDFGDSILLCFVGLVGPGVGISKGNVSVTAPSYESAKLILNDYLSPKSSE